MEFLIIAIAILIGGLGLVVWFRVTDEWAERDEFRRFQAAMRALDDDDDRYTDDDPRRPA